MLSVGCDQPLRNCNRATAPATGLRFSPNCVKTNSCNQRVKMKLLSFPIVCVYLALSLILVDAQGSSSYPTRLICNQNSGNESLELELNSQRLKIYEGYLYSGPLKSQAVVFAPVSSRVKEETQGVVLRGNGNLQMELAVIKEIMVGGFSQPGRLILQSSKEIKSKVFDHCWMTWTKFSGKLDPIEI